MRLKINLATKRYLDQGVLNGAIWGAGIVLFLFLGYEVNRCAFLAGELKRVVAETHSLQRGKVEVVSESQYRLLKAHIGFANKVLERKALNWLSLLDYLESVTPEGVALTRVEPVPNEGLVKINGAARGFSNIKSFLENLERSPHFSEVFLLGQNETKVGLTQQGILFSLSFRVNFR